MCVRTNLYLHVPCNHYSKPKVEFCYNIFYSSKEITTTTTHRWTRCPACSGAAIPPANVTQTSYNYDYFPLSPLRPLSPIFDLFSARWGNADSAANARIRLRHQQNWALVGSGIYVLCMAMGLMALAFLETE